MKIREINLTRVNVAVHPEYVFLQTWCGLLVGKSPLSMFTDHQLALLQCVQPLLCIAKNERQIFYISSPVVLKEIRKRGMDRLHVVIVDKAMVSEMVVASHMRDLISGYDQVNNALVLRLRDLWPSEDDFMLMSNWNLSVRLLAAVTGVSASSLQRCERRAEIKRDQLSQNDLSRNS